MFMVGGGGGGGGAAAAAGTAAPATTDADAATTINFASFVGTTGPTHVAGVVRRIEPQNFSPMWHEY